MRLIFLERPFLVAIRNRTRRKVSVGGILSVEKQFAHSDLNGRQVIALRALEKSKRITRKQYEELTGASAVTAKRDLTDLVNKRVLVRRGATRNLWYELSGQPMTRK
jgi:predicted HTH transcriptional regulator